MPIRHLLLGGLLAVAALAPVPTPARAQRASLQGIVFEDANRNGRRDPGEQGIAGVAVSNQDDVVLTDAGGAFTIARGSTGIVFVSVPDGRASVGPFWRATGADDSVSFALHAESQPRTFRFVHASDTHIAPDKVDRFRRFHALVDSIHPDLVLITGDLVRDAMSTPQPKSESYFELFRTEAASFTTPVRTVPGNHDHFGIIPWRLQVDHGNPLYNRGMYRKYFGPDYYSFTFGGIHFVGLNTLMPDDSAYYGRVDSLQLAWLARDLEHVAPTTPVVTFMHIPFVAAFYDLPGYFDGPVGALAYVNGETVFRHMVSNTAEVLDVLLRGNRRVLALGGHSHTGEKMVFQTTPEPMRFEISAAIVGPEKVGPLPFPSGFTLYTVVDGRIDAGTFVPLDPP
jgi:hypothetical protein